MPKIEFYYDVVCPYAYLAAKQLLGWPEEHVQVEWIPILLGGIFRKNQSPDVPAQTWSSSKLTQNAKDLMRQAQKHHVSLRHHPKHPRRSVDAMRMLCMIEPQQRPQLSLKLFHAYWEEGRDISDHAVLNSIAESVGLPKDLFATSKAKERLFSHTEMAHQKGIFGVPSMVLNEKMWWGQDRIHFVKEAVSFKKKTWPVGQASSKSLEIFHDFASPFSYLAMMQIKKMEQLYQISIKKTPILLGAIFKEIGTPNVPLFAMSEPKRQYMLRDLQDWSTWWNTPFSFPNKFPIRSVLPLRISIIEPNLTIPLYKAAWAEGRDISSEETLKDIVQSQGYVWDDIQKALPIAKIALHEHTSRAIKCGVFGVPTLKSNEELWWGQDRLYDVAEYLCKS